MIICVIISISTTLIGLILNIAMLISIIKKHGFKRNVLFANIGKSNAVFSMGMLATVMTASSGRKMSLILECILFSILLASSFAQLFANVILAIDRYIATSFPLKHRQTTTWKLWKKSLLIGEAMCIMIASVLASISLVLKKKYIVTKALMISRLMAIVMLALLYYKVFEKFRKSKVNLSEA